MIRLITARYLCELLDRLDSEVSLNAAQRAELIEIAEQRDRARNWAVALEQQLARVTDERDTGTDIITGLAATTDTLIADVERLTAELNRVKHGAAELARVVDVMAVCMRAAVRDADLGEPERGVEFLRDMVYDTGLDAPAPLGSYASGAALMDAESTTRGGAA